jgi:inosose dehydratase
VTIPAAAPTAAARDATPTGTRLGGALDAAPVGVVPIIWNNADLPQLGSPLPADEVLDEIARLGYAGTQLGVGFPTGAELQTKLRARYLRLAEVYAALPCDADGPGPAALELALERLAVLHAAGGDVLVVALERVDERDNLVGRADAAPRLTDAGWRALGDLLNHIAAKARELGHAVAFHNHGATFVETPDEVGQLLAMTDVRRVGLCLDVGHAILGGGDPVALLRRHRDRVIHVHLKDVDPAPLADLREGRLTGFVAALERRIFAPLGSGVLDLPGVLSVLAERSYRGWLMVEQDTSWEPASEAAAIGRHVLGATLRWLIANGAVVA